MSEFQAAPPAPVHRTRPFYWSVRRELWESRWLYLAPLAFAGFILFGYCFYALMLPKHLRLVASQGVYKQREVILMPFSAVAGAVMLTSLLVSIFYCLESFQSERRDRSILFWKSLPVSDRTTVLSKATIPLGVMPVMMFALVAAAQVVMLQFTLLRLASDRPDYALFWTHMKFGQMLLAELYGLIAIAAWYAPLYTWFMLVSAWAKNAVILWSALPFLALFAIEHIVFSTDSFAHLIGYRFSGWYTRAFSFPPHGAKVCLDPLQYLTPGKYLATPGLWAGLLFAAGFLFFAARLRRLREPA